jgi:elongation factor P
MEANDLRKGTIIFYQGELYVCLDFHRGSPGNKRAFVQASFKGLTNGRTFQNKFASDEEFERAALDPKQCQYLYHDAEGFHFMDMESFHTFSISDEMIGDNKYYLREQMEIKIQFYEGNPVLPEFPKAIVLKVTDAPPGIRGDSVSNTMKTATCETGLKVQVPLFIKEGDMIRINTESGEYTGRE